MFCFLRAMTFIQSSHFFLNEHPRSFPGCDRGGVVKSGAVHERRRVGRAGPLYLKTVCKFARMARFLTMSKLGRAIVGAGSASGKSRPHRLVGLGHRAFNAATRVRIPLGTPSVPLVSNDL